jgi:hypothetical protein
MGFASLSGEESIGEKRCTNEAPVEASAGKPFTLKLTGLNTEEFVSGVFDGA